MILTLKLRKWVPLNGLTHIGTNWVVATDVGMLNQLDTVSSTTDIDVYYSSVTIPIGHTYYISAQRQLSDGSLTPWTTPVPVTNTDTDNGLVLSHDITVDKPIVMVDTDVLHDRSQDELIIRTTSFRGEGDGHGSTSYIILGDNNKLLYRNLYDTVNKTEVSISKDGLDIESHNDIRILVAHNTTLGVESEFGVAKVNYRNFNFIVKNKLDRVVPYSDHTLFIEKVDTSLLTGIVRIDIKTLDEDTLIWSQLISNDVLEFNIPGTILEPNSTYRIELVSKTSNTGVSSKVLILKTVDNIVSDTLDISYKYDKVLTPGIPLTTPRVPGAYSGIELFNNYFMIPSTTTQATDFIAYNYNLGKLEVTNRVVGGMDLISSNNTDTYLTYLADHRVLIDTYDTTTAPVFLVFRYNIFNNTSELLGVRNRPTEQIPLGRTGGMHRITNDTFIYTEVNSNNLYTLDITDMSITTMAIPPLTNVSTLTSLDIGNGNILLIGGDGTQSVVYDIGTDTYSDGPNIPVKFRNRELKVTRLVNGDSIVVRTTPSVDDTDSNMLYFDLTEGTLTELENTLGPGFHPNINLTLKTGKVLLGSSDGTQDTYYEFT